MELAGKEAERLAPDRAIVHGEAGIGHPQPGEEEDGEDGSFCETSVY
jgi:hypothetical protein